MSGHWFCKCCGQPPRDCAIFSDQFGRDAGTDLGSDWDEISGDWWIWDEDAPHHTGEGDRLEETGNAGAVVKCTVPHPANHWNAGELVVGMDQFAVGDKRSLLINYKDASNYIFVQWERIDSTRYGVKLGRVAAGSSTDYTSQKIFDLGGSTDSIEGEVCFGPTGSDDKVLVVVGGLSSNEVGIDIYACIDTHAAGKYIGLRNDTATPAYWYLVSWTEHWDTNPSAGCPYCFCTCEEVCIPATLLATFVNISGCAVLDGVTANLLADFGSWSSTDQGVEADWSTVGTVDCNGHEFSIAFTCCDQATPENCQDVGGEISRTSFFLILGNTDPCVHSPTSIRAAAAPKSTCDPLSLRFGPFTIASDNGCNCCDGTVYIVVTEPP